MTDDRSSAPAIAVTGATGFLGQAVVAAARRADQPVIAIGRRNGAAPSDWTGDDGIDYRVMDLGGPQVADALARVLKDAGTVVHVAAAMSGDPEIHRRDTIGATETLLSAFAAALADGSAPRLVLVSSIAVYDYLALPVGAVLDESSPVETRPERRDAYAQAKLRQETLARALLPKGLDLTILRPGAIYGPGRIHTASLGIERGRRLLCIGGHARVPAIHVDRCAEAILRAARRPADGLAILNLVDPDPPTQQDWIAATGRQGVVTVPRAPFVGLAGALESLSSVLPPLARRFPATLRRASLAARYKPLSFSTAQAEAVLGPAAPSPGFAALMRASGERDAP